MTPPGGGPRIGVGRFVVVSGGPGSGKSTLAPVLAERLGLPLIAKDTIKEAMMTVLPVPDVDASREIGRAAVAAVYALARANGGGVLDSVWHRSRALIDLAALPGRIVEVCCRCDRAVVEERYRRRGRDRVAGHFSSARTSAELWSTETTEPVAGGWPVIDVDTTGPVDVVACTAAVLAGFESRRS